jgi:hypothetical protein
MPLDMTTSTMISELPSNIDFDVSFEPTKVTDKKYVINNDTGEYLSVVGSGFNCVSHPDFFSTVQDAMTEKLDPEDLNNVSTSWRVCRNNSWVMMDTRLNDVKAKIQTDSHETTITPRIIALHGVDGSCSNQVHFGKIDMFCTNGMITGTHESVKRKNTSGFDLDIFKDRLVESRSSFYDEVSMLQHWANKSISLNTVDDLIKSIVKSDRKSEKMLDLFRKEASVRGSNVFSLYSAFTNYASYADQRNGFTLKQTGNDTNASSMWEREVEVTKWVSSSPFQSLLAA